jgi:hypothetical protein
MDSAKQLFKQKLQKRTIQEAKKAVKNGIRIVVDLSQKKTGNWAIDALREEVRKQQ